MTSSDARTVEISPGILRGPTLGLVGLVLVADGSTHQLGNWIVMPR